MNCRIVGGIWQHNFVQAQAVLVSFQRKTAHYFEIKSEKPFHFLKKLKKNTDFHFSFYNFQKK